MKPLVLVGMMGSGKTTVGRAVAERLGRPFTDSDAEVEARCGRTVREIFQSDGEPAFRVLETEVLTEALARDDAPVIAAAGGVVLDGENRDRLVRSAEVVWLTADPAVLAERAASGDHRPLLGDDPEAALVRFDAERRPLYTEVATHIVDVGERSADDAVAEVLRLVGATR